MLIYLNSLLLLACIAFLLYRRHSPTRDIEVDAPMTYSQERHHNEKLRQEELDKIACDICRKSFKYELCFAGRPSPCNGEIEKHSNFDLQWQLERDICIYNGDPMIGIRFALDELGHYQEPAGFIKFSDIKVNWRVDSGFVSLNSSFKRTDILKSLDPSLIQEKKEFESTAEYKSFVKDLLMKNVQQ